jgi:exodeoxyribonuclease VII large subunit
METQTDITFYSPSAIISTFNAALQNLTERKILPIKGIYQFVEGTKYGGYYYDKLKDEATDKSIKLLVPELLRKDLKNNTTIEIRGYITRKLDNYGRIELQIVVTELLEQRINKFSEEDIKKIDLLNRKTEVGFKDLDSVIKKKIFDQQTITVHVIMGKNAIIDNDIKKQLSEGIALYNIQFHKVSLTTPSEITSKIALLDSGSADVICLSRGGGENLEIFDKPEICEAALNCQSIIASAIGHADNITLFEKISDKKFSTPTAFGQYLKEIYNNTIHDFEQSKAKLAEDIKRTLEANFGKQISNLNQQLIAVKELNTKTLVDKEALYQKTLLEAKNLHATQVDGMKKQIESIQAQFTLQLQEQKKVLDDKEKNLNTHIQSLVREKEEKDKLLSQAKGISDQFRASVDSLQKQLASVQSSNWTTIIIASIIALIFGVVIGKAIF